MLGSKMTTISGLTRSQTPFRIRSVEIWDPVVEEEQETPALAIELPECNCPDFCERDHEND
jgi:hypothetical protein